MLSFDEAVERIKELDAQEGMTAFEMGDVALEQAPIGEGNANNGSAATLQALAEQAGVPLSTLQERRRVSHRVPLTRRLGSVPWSVYQIIANLGDVTQRASLLDRIETEAPPEPHKRWSVNAVRMAIGWPPTNGTAAITEEAAIERLAQAPPEVKRTAIETIAQDPVVLEDPMVRGRLTNAMHAGAERREARIEAEDRQNPALQPLLNVTDGLKRGVARLDIEKACLRLEHEASLFVRTVEEKVAVTGPIGETREQFWIGRSLETIEAAVTTVRALLEGRTAPPSVDTLLESVFTGTGERDA